MNIKKVIVGSALVLMGAQFQSVAIAADKDASVVDLAPQQYTALTRNTNFYANPENKPIGDNSLFERRYLLGDFGGYRDEWAKNGFLLDAGITQGYQNVVSGQGDNDKAAGSGDLWLGIDSGRAGWWPGGLIFAHAEMAWGDPVTGTGGVLPLNFDTTMPYPGTDEIKLSELYLFQALPHEWAAMIGKVGWTNLMDKNLFANDERNQFMHTGLNNNAILALFVPYTSLGGGLFKQINKDWAAGVVLTSNSTNADSAGFDDFDLDEMTLGASINWTPTFEGKPGLYSLLLGATNKDTFDLKHFIPDVEFERSLESQSSNYAIALSVSQYAWVSDSASRYDGQPAGVGFFLRAGAAPDDRSVIDQFYSVGVGGTLGLFGRTQDNWGIGWAGTHYSSYLRDDLEFIGDLVGFTGKLEGFEHAVEAYYNIAITPAVRLTINVQYIDSSLDSVDEPTILGTRLQIDL